MATSASCVKKAQMKESDETEKRSEVVAVAPPCSLFPRIPSLQSVSGGRSSMHASCATNHEFVTVS